MQGKEINYYRLGKKYARCTFDDPMWESLPCMDEPQRIEFNRGYDDALSGPTLEGVLFVLFLISVVVLAMVMWI